MPDSSIHDDNRHPIIVMAGEKCKDLGDAVCNYMDILRSPSCSKPFANGESMVKLRKTNVRGKDVFVIVSLCRQHAATLDGYTGINDCLMELLVFGDTLRRASAQRITAVVPCFGYARQDRKAEGRTPITARLVADLIVEAGFNRVLTMDLHADQIQGFFPREVPLDHLNAGQLFADHVASMQIPNAVVLSPDIGNIKKAEKYRRGFPAGIDIAVIDKVRDPDTGEVVSRRLIGEVKDKNVLMFDDIISTATTMRRGIDFALSKGAKDFYIFATHGEFVGDAIGRLTHPAIKQICVTDTVSPAQKVRDALPLKVLSIDELFGEAIIRIHNYESISELLGIYG